ncbi:MAG: endolytic transglycosylase MltG [Gammaproteobacteria bacterium]|nr:endolytic transglycosylase MltG [Gammaproteobacteria bacterium]
MLLGLISLVAAVYLIHREFNQPLPVGHKSTTIKVLPGMHIYNFSRALYQKRLIQHPELVNLIVRWQGRARKLRYGEYQLEPGMSLHALLANVVQGRELVQHKITFVEGWTFAQVRQALAQDKNINDDLKGLSNAAVMKKLGYAGQHPEGLFFPDTYQFVWRTNASQILQQSYQEMQRRLKQAWQDRAENSFYKTPYQALIVASLIEKESSVAADRPLISGVILARLKRNMRLQVDPTVLYGLDKVYGTPITKADLKSKNPYNTYQIEGLPPTPIAMPGAAAIYASLHPLDKGYLYYVAKGDGSHIFTKSYQQHLKAVNQYQRQQQELKKFESVSIELFRYYLRHNIFRRYWQQAKF